MPFLTLDNEALFYEFYDHGSSRNIVFVHGAGGDRRHWPRAAVDLPGCNEYVLDLPGHGNSKGQGRDNATAYAEVVSRFVQALGLARVTLCGHSMGGAIAQTVALTQPPWLDALVLAGSGARLKVLPVYIEQLATDFAAVIDATCHALFWPGVSPEMVEAELNRYLSVDWRVLRGDFLACNSFDVMNRLGEIKWPTLVITGSTDLLTPVKYAQFLKDNLPQAELVVMPATGHMLAMERPGEFLNAIAEFMDKLA